MMGEGGTWPGRGKEDIGSNGGSGQGWVGMEN